MSEFNPFGVRKATPADAEALFDFLIPIYIESAMQPVSPAKLRDMIERCVNMDRAIAGIIGNAERSIIATIGLKIEEFDYTDHSHLRDAWLFVHPQHRRENHAKNLLAFAKWCQEGMQAAAGVSLPLFIEILTKDDLEPKLHSYQRLLPQAGALFSWGTTAKGAFDQVRLSDGRNVHGEKGAALRRRSVLVTRQAV